ncbi:hypothetical protein [Diaphorobacter caeni]|uniref:hypothetical protein n=1 Tax=Diaphorobacter caeni TaxID=2784387 RepID=UPI00188EAE54|nr:hypothetical protein [Diaphorobacter caeni]MBF5004723.1 hypothetical protein [Diaphorobacter caeni]
MLIKSVWMLLGVLAGAPASSEVSGEDLARSWEAQIRSLEAQTRMQKQTDGVPPAPMELRQPLEKLQKQCGSDFLVHPYIGMSESQFMNCSLLARRWQLLRVDEYSNANGPAKQFVFPEGAPARYVDTERGRVTGVHR